MVTVSPGASAAISSAVSRFSTLTACPSLMSLRSAMNGLTHAALIGEEAVAVTQPTRDPPSPNAGRTRRTSSIGRRGLERLTRSCARPLVAGTCRAVTPRRPGSGGGGTSGGVEVAKQGLADVAHRRDLLGGELVEQMRAHALDVHRRGGLQGGEPLLGEDGELAAAVVRADLPADPAALLQPGHGVRETAAGGQAAVGELTHPHHPVRALRQRDTDLAGAVRDPRLTGELAVETVLKQQRAVEPGAPGLLLVGIQPPGLAGRPRRLRGL